MTLREKWAAECTKIGLIFKVWVARTLYTLAGIAALQEYLPGLPPMITDIIPTWLKYVILGAAIISHLYGGTTVAKPKDNGQV